MRRTKHSTGVKFNAPTLNSSGSTNLQVQDSDRRRTGGDFETRGQGNKGIPPAPFVSPHDRPTLTESEERQLMLRLEELARIEGLREDKARIKISSTTQALIDSKADDSEVLKRDGSVVLEGSFTFRELSADPDDPDEGHAVMWLSDGTGSGDDGDIMVKITAGGATKTTTLVDFSAI